MSNLKKKKISDSQEMLRSTTNNAKQILLLLFYKLNDKKKKNYSTYENIIINIVLFQIKSFEKNNNIFSPAPSISS